MVEFVVLNFVKLSAEDIVVKRDEEIVKFTEYMRLFELFGDVVGEF